MTAGNDLPVALACHHERLLYFVTRLSAGDCAKDRNGSSALGDERLLPGEHGHCC